MLARIASTVNIVRRTGVNAEFVSKITLRGGSSNALKVDPVSALHALDSHDNRSLICLRRNKLHFVTPEAIDGQL